MDKAITGSCRHGVYQRKGDACFFCGFCSIDGNDYSQSLRNVKPFDLLD